MNCNHKNKTIMIYPDFSSSGVWCECGTSFGNPKSKFSHVPEGIFELVQLWNDYWEEVSFNDHSSYLDGVTLEVIKYHENRLVSMGKELYKIISKYNSCIFVEDNVRINLKVSDE